MYLTTIKRFQFKSPLNMIWLADKLDEDKHVKIKKKNPYSVSLQYGKLNYVLRYNNPVLHIHFRIPTMWYVWILGVPIILAAVNVGLEFYISPYCYDVLSTFVVLFTIVWLVTGLTVFIKIKTKAFLTLFKEKIL